MSNTWSRVGTSSTRAPGVHQLPASEGIRSILLAMVTIPPGVAAIAFGLALALAAVELSLLQRDSRLIVGWIPEGSAASHYPRRGATDWLIRTWLHSPRPDPNLLSHWSMTSLLPVWFGPGPTVIDLIAW